MMRLKTFLVALAHVLIPGVGGTCLSTRPKPVLSDHYVQYSGCVLIMISFC